VRYSGNVKKRLGALATLWLQKFFDGKENTWDEDQSLEESWGLDDPSMPGWLKQYL
jgi:hypothetical protein